MAQAHKTRQAQQAQQVAVIGAGLAGLCMAIRLRQCGVDDFTVFEQADDLGGVWRDNTYPGAGCDVPSHLYSYSFARSGDLSRAFGHLFPAQHEVLAYLHGCAERFGVLAHLRLGTAVTAARWDDDTHLWRLWTTAGHEHAARVLVCATGSLGRPRLPDVPGLSSFRGAAFHSARWDHGRDLTGRRIAVIGTGPSAVQLVPRIADTARRVTVFQRTANWVLPQGNRPRRPVTTRSWAARPAVWAYPWLRGERVPYWPMRGGHASRRVRAAAQRHLRRQVPDLRLRAQLTPDVPVGCRRAVVSDDWFPTLARPDVELVTAPITRLRRDGVESADGRHFCVDTVVYATGFHPTFPFAAGSQPRSVDPVLPVPVHGRGGLPLDEAWHTGAGAYLGMEVPGFPNLYLVHGPGAGGLGGEPAVAVTEAQVRYVLRRMQHGPTVREVPMDQFTAWQARRRRALPGPRVDAACGVALPPPGGLVLPAVPLPGWRYRTLLRRAA